MKIQVCCDNVNSWMVPYAMQLVAELQQQHDALFIDDTEKVTKGDILLMLSCEKIFKKLDLNKYNLVVHESALPQGKGWSPLTWQVLEEKNKIPVTLFEADLKVDSGVIYNQVFIELDGSELIDELRHKQALATRQLFMDFLAAYPNVTSTKQKGEESFYRKRGPEDSELDIDKTIKEQFNLLRVCDNERYPAYFVKNGVKYLLRIEKA